MITKNEIKYLKDFSDKKHRYEEQKFVVEGEKMAEELLKHHRELIYRVYATEDFLLSHIIVLGKLDTCQVTETELQRISQLKSANKVLILCSFINSTDEESKLTLVLDGINDPGNLGTIIRIADWFGISHIYCSENTVDMYSPKVIQASMGSLFRVNIIYKALHPLLDKTNKAIYFAELEGDNIFKTELPKEAIIVIGSESHGISKSLYSFPHKSINIPNYSNGATSTESLNAAVATALICGQFSK